MDEDDRQWRGVHVSALQTSLNRYQYPKLILNQNEHTILVKLPIVVGQLPESYPPIHKSRDCWDQTHVKLPCSPKNLTKNHEHRWETIQKEFVDISSSHQLEKAILNYNNRYSDKWNFSALHLFFDEILEEDETKNFFETLFPKIVDLALRLPQLITDGIPLLRHGHKCSVSLSQIQIASLLANAFLCTFPHRNWSGSNAEYSDYPDINFNRLFQCDDSSRVDSVHEKLKCILNYFRRVTTSAPTGIVTYSRQYVPSHLLPDWLKSEKKLPKLHVSSSGTIEDDGFGFFQLDFANKFVGGGVLGTGCVQEEIRFVVCPELIVSRLFTQVLGENEALVVIGCERFNRYQGYGHTFEWEGDYVDDTPADEYGRKYCTVIAVDALCYQSNPRAQYMLGNIARDLKKAYIGFSWGSGRKKEELCAVATGNWGCGVFGGDPQLKSIMQLLAAGQADRDLAYFTFGDTQLRDAMAGLHEFLIQNDITVGKICHLLMRFSRQKKYESVDLFEFLKMEVLTKEKPFSNEERHSKLVSAKKTLNGFSTTKLAMYENHSFCRTIMNETANRTDKMNDSDSDSDISRRSEKQPEPSSRLQVDAREERLKREELRLMSGFYEKANLPPQRDDFEVLGELKQKMKNSFQKKSTEQLELEIDDGLQKLESDISTQLSINEEEDVKSNHEDEREQNEISACNDEENENEEAYVADSSSEKFNKSAAIKTVEEDEIADIEGRTVSSPVTPSSTQNSPVTPSSTQNSPVTSSSAQKSSVTPSSTLGPLSQISARISKRPTPSRSKISKEHSCQKRKLPDYFNPLNISFKKNA